MRNEWFEFPFTEESVKRRFVGKELIVAKNHIPSPVMEETARIILTDKPVGDGHYKVEQSGTIKTWRVSDGVLFLCGAREKNMFVFNGSEVMNASHYAVGESLCEASLTGFMRVVLYPFRPITEVNLRVAISTHKDYHESTVDRLVKTLKRTGIKSEDILVVVAEGEGCDFARDAEYVCASRGRFGYTAIDHLPEGADYWLLLNDTCEATADFGIQLKRVDIGIQYDVIRWTRVVAATWRSTRQRSWQTWRRPVRRRGQRRLKASSTCNRSWCPG